MQPEGADDLDVLFPKDKTVRVNGEDIKFTEYGFYAGLLIRNAAKGFIQELASVLKCHESEMLDKVDTAFENHAGVIIECVAMACGKTSQWVMSLDEKDGRAVDNAWWEICSPFFVRCAKRSLHSAKTQKMDVGQMCGEHSSITDTAPTE